MCNPCAFPLLVVNSAALLLVVSSSFYQFVPTLVCVFLPGFGVLPQPASSVLKICFFVVKERKGKGKPVYNNQSCNQLIFD